MYFINKIYVKFEFFLLHSGIKKLILDKDACWK